MVELRKQVTLQVPDEVGRLAEITECIKKARINIQALSAWAHGGMGYVTFLTEDHDKAVTAISPIVDQCEFSEVIWATISDEPGALHELARKLTDGGVSVKSVYSIGCEHARQARVVMQTENNQRALKVLQGE